MQHGIFLGEDLLSVIPLVGLEEIGMNMTSTEYGDDMIIIEAGLMFPKEDRVDNCVIQGRPKNKMVGLPLPYQGKLCPHSHNQRSHGIDLVVKPFVRMAEIISCRCSFPRDSTVKTTFVSTTERPGASLSWTMPWMFPLCPAMMPVKVWS